MPSSFASAAICSWLRWNVKRPSAISSAKCFFILCLSIGSNREPDPAGIMLGGLAPHLIGNAGQPAFRRLQKLLALPRALLGQLPIAASAQPLAGKVGRGDLGQIAAVE